MYRGFNELIAALIKSEHSSEEIMAQIKVHQKKMNKYKTSDRKEDLYDIGDGLTLMNIVIKNENWKKSCSYI